MGAICMSKKNIISKENADEQLQIILDYYDIDASALPEKQASIVETVGLKIVKAIMRGDCEIKDVDGEPMVIQTTKKGSDLRYGVITGKSRTEMAKTTDNDHYGKIFSMLGSLSGVGKDAIESLKGPDLVLAEAIGMLFLQA
jgi:hypothetical protein